jgi:hypothetical protein
MLPKLNYPYKVENRGNTNGTIIFVIDKIESPPKSIKMFVKLDFLQMFRAFGVVVTLKVTVLNS